MLKTEGKRFSIVNLGCKVNRVEADSAAAALLSNGWQASNEEDADLIVVNTCTVTGEADKKARKAVRHALTVNDHARVVVSGCAIAIDPDSFKALDERVEIVPRNDLVAAIGGQKHALLRVGEGFRTRVNVKVQDGCDHACTYCIVHTARGPAHSKALPDVVSEAREYFEHGAKELVLTGIDIGSYRYGSQTLIDLLKELVACSREACPPGELPARIRLSSIEPMSIDGALAEFIASTQGLICRHLHLPLQSGSSKVLAEMDRPYDAQEYASLVEGLYQLMPQLSLSTDIIVGFPGETEEDFAATMDLARACGFSRIHVFPYSMRKGTPAAARSDQVDSEVKAKRAKALRDLAAELRQEDRARRAGTRELALVEEKFALTESYHEIAVPDGCAIGSLVEVDL